MSVVIPAYNGGSLLEEAIRSALDQTVPPWEVIVVDDGSTDETPALLAQFGSAITVLRQANAGTAAARNAGIAAAIGELIALLDQDDVWDRSKLESQLPAFDDPAVGLVHGGARFMTADGTVTSVEVAVPDLDVHALLTWCWIIQSTPLIRASALRDVGGFDTALSAADDWDMWIRLADRYRLVASPGCHVTVHIHDANQSHDAHKMYAAARRLSAKQAQLHGSSCQACRRAARYRERRNRQEYYRRMRELSAARAREGRPLAAARATLAGLRRHPRALYETAAFHVRAQGSHPPALPQHDLLAEGPTPLLSRTAAAAHRLPAGRSKVRLGRVLAYALASARLTDPVVPVRLRDGTVMLLDARGRTEGDAVWNGCYEGDLLDALDVCMPDGGGLLDIGANVGLIAVPMARRLAARGATVQAVEPVAINRERLAASAALSQVTVAVYGVALGDHEGVVEMSRDDGLGATTGNAIMGEAGTGYGTTSTVALTTLDRLDEEHSLGPVDVVKLDIEGAEVALLRGATQFLARHRPLIFGEFNAELLPRFGHSFLDVADVLLPLGYRILAFRAAGDPVEVAAEVGRGDVLMVPSEHFERTVLQLQALRR